MHSIRNHHPSKPAVFQDTRQLWPPLSATFDLCQLSQQQQQQQRQGRRWRRRQLILQQSFAFWRLLFSIQRHRRRGLRYGTENRFQSTVKTKSWTLHTKSIQTLLYWVLQETRWATSSRQTKSVLANCKIWNTSRPTMFKQIAHRTAFKAHQDTLATSIFQTHTCTHFHRSYHVHTYPNNSH